MRGRGIVFWTSAAIMAATMCTGATATLAGLGGVRTYRAHYVSDVGYRWLLTPQLRQGIAASFTPGSPRVVYLNVSAAQAQLGLKNITAGRKAWIFTPDGDAAMTLEAYFALSHRLGKSLNFGDTTLPPVRFLVLHFKFEYNGLPELPPEGKTVLSEAGSQDASGLMMPEKDKAAFKKLLRTRPAYVAVVGPTDGGGWLGNQQEAPGCRAAGEVSIAAMWNGSGKRVTRCRAERAIARFAG